VQKIIKESTLPPGYRFDVGGRPKDMEESFRRRSPRSASQ
jgi:hypothetical protein